MKHKWIQLLLLFALMAAVLTPSAWAADEVDEFISAMSRFQTNISVGVRDADALLTAVFERDPKAYFYYNGYSYVSTTSGLEFEMSYKNTSISRDEILTVANVDQLMAAVGLAAADKQTMAYFVTVDGYLPTEDEINDISERMRSDYYLLWCGVQSYYGNYWECSFTAMRSYEYEISYWNDASAQTLTTWRDETESALISLAGSLFAQDMPDYYKAYLIHDYLVDSCTYNMAGVDVTNWEDHIPYGALIKQLCVCQGYAEAFRLLMQAAGVECISVIGTADGVDHMWNAVELDGEWYMVDPTWDDPVTSDGSAVKSYDYFVITSDQLSQDHVWETADYPTCTSTALNYTTVQQLVDADQNTYTDYDSSLVRTQAIERAELEAFWATNDADDATQDDTAAITEADDPTQDDPADMDATQPEETGDDTQDDTTADTTDNTSPDDPADEADDTLDDTLQKVVQLRQEQQQRLSLTLSQTVLLVVILLAVCVITALLIIWGVSNRRIQKARAQRLQQRERRVENAFRGRRRRY
jgi:hypothetical protein